MRMPAEAFALQPAYAPCPHLFGLLDYVPSQGEPFVAVS